MLVVTALPTALLLALVALDHAPPPSRHRGRYTTSTLVLSYVLLPVVFGKIVATFDCDGDFDGSACYLRADYTIDYYRQAKTRTSETNRKNRNGKERDEVHTDRHTHTHAHTHTHTHTHTHRRTNDMI